MPKADKVVLNGWTLYADIGLPGIRWHLTVCEEIGIAKDGTVETGIVQTGLILGMEDQTHSRVLKEKSPLS